MLSVHPLVLGAGAVAVLVRVFGDIDVAEEAVQRRFLRGRRAALSPR